MYHCHPLSENIRSVASNSAVLPYLVSACEEGFDRDVTTSTLAIEKKMKGVAMTMAMLAADLFVELRSCPPW